MRGLGFRVVNWVSLELSKGDLGAERRLCAVGTTYGLFSNLFGSYLVQTIVWRLVIQIPKWAPFFGNSRSI